MGVQVRSRIGLRIGTFAIAAILTATMLIVLAPGAGATPTNAPGASSSGTARGESLPVAGPIGSLQSLVNSAKAGSTVHLPAGTFVEQLRINKNLRLVGAGVGKTILQSPVNMTPDSLGNVFVIEIGHHATVQISQLTVRVTEQCELANDIGVGTGGGVGVADNATLSIWGVSDAAYGPYPDLNQPCTTSTGSAGMLSFGRAISIGLDDPTGDGTNTQVEGHGSIEQVRTQGFDIFSLSVGGIRGPSGSTATILDNRVRVGPGPYTAAYGIVAYGVSTIENNLVTGIAGSDGGIAVVYTSAIVTGNTVRNFTCTTVPFPITPPCGVDPFYDDQDLGIFLAGITPGTVVAHNLIDRVDAGILIEGPGAPALVIHNTIRSSTYYGLDLIDANQTFRDDTVIGGLYAIAVGADAANTSAVLLHDALRGYSVSLALLEANYPWVASVVVRSG